MKPETKALRFIENGDAELKSIAEVLQATKTDLEETAELIGKLVQSIEDQAGGIIAAKEILGEMRKK